MLKSIHKTRNIEFYLLWDYGLVFTYSKSKIRDYIIQSPKLDIYELARRVFRPSGEVEINNP